MIEMRKKALVMLVLMAFCFQMLSWTTANAELFPRSIGANSVYVDISIVQGRVSASGECAGIAGGDYKITVALQEQNGGKWKTVATASGGRSASVACRAKKGNAYQLKVTGYFYDAAGTLLETVRRTSPSKTY